MDEKGMDINAGLSDEKNGSSWLKYSYDDIRYIIVPNGNACIDMIMSLHDNKFCNGSDVAIQKYVLIRKIIVLDNFIWHF